MRLLSGVKYSERAGAVEILTSIQAANNLYIHKTVIGDSGQKFGLVIDGKNANTLIAFFHVLKNILLHRLEKARIEQERGTIVNLVFGDAFGQLHPGHNPFHFALAVDCPG